MFVPITSDVAFATYAGVVAALLLLSIALLGHLLGFHIYLSKYMHQYNKSKCMHLTRKFKQKSQNAIALFSHIV